MIHIAPPTPATPPRAWLAMQAKNLEPANIAEITGAVETAASNQKDYANAMPANLITSHQAALNADLGVKYDSTDMVGYSGEIIPLTPSEAAKFGEHVPAVQVRNMGVTARARLLQLAENPALIRDYLSSGVSANRLASLVNMSVAGFESWVDEMGFMEFYSAGRRSGTDIYINRAESALSSVIDIDRDTRELAEKMLGADPNDHTLMEEIRMDEWRMGVLKAGGEYSLKKAKLQFDGYHKLAASIAPERYAPRNTGGSDIQHGSVAFNITIGSEGSAGTVIRGGQEMNNGQATRNTNIPAGIVIGGSSTEVKGV